MDHVNHDMKMGRFPNQSSVETFLKERETLAAQEKAGHLPSGPSERDGDGELAALSAGAPKGEWHPDYYDVHDEDGGPTEMACEGIVSFDDGDDAGQIATCNERVAKFICALVNAYRSGKLKEV